MQSARLRRQGSQILYSEMQCSKGFRRLLRLKNILWIIGLFRAMNQAHDFIHFYPLPNMQNEYIQRKNFPPLIYWKV